MTTSDVAGIVGHSVPPARRVCYMLAVVLLVSLSLLSSHFPSSGKAFIFFRFQRY
jgi:hypothetical protein